MQQPTKGLIVLEGPDGGGKTTLAKAIGRVTDAHYLHLTYRWKDRMFQYHTAGLLHALKKSRDQLVVIDRLWPSERVYADAFRGGTKWPLMGRLMDRVLRRFGAAYVFCIPGTEDRWWAKYLADQDAGKVEMYQKDDRLRQVYQGYRALSGSMLHRQDTWLYDYMLTLPEGQSLDLEPWAKHTLIDGTVRVQRQRQLPAALDVNLPNYGGHAYQARFLLVGDKPNYKSRQALWPFYEHANSSLFLTEALQRVGIGEEDLCWININDARGPELVDQTLLHNPRLVPIVLGEDAKETYLRTVDEGLPMIPWFIKHPSYYRRFHHNDGLLDHVLQEIKHAR